MPACVCKMGKRRRSQGSNLDVQWNSPYPISSSESGTCFPLALAVVEQEHSEQATRVNTRHTRRRLNYRARLADMLRLRRVWVILSLWPDFHGQCLNGEKEEEDRERRKEERKCVWRARTNDTTAELFDPFAPRESPPSSACPDNNNNWAPSPSLRAPFQPENPSSFCHQLFHIASGPTTAVGACSGGGSGQRRRRQPASQTTLIY